MHPTLLLHNPRRHGWQRLPNFQIRPVPRGHVNELRYRQSFGCQPTYRRLRRSSEGGWPPRRAIHCLLSSTDRLTLKLWLTKKTFFEAQSKMAALIGTVNGDNSGRADGSGPAKTIREMAPGVLIPRITSRHHVHHVPEGPICDSCHQTLVLWYCI